MTYESRTGMTNQMETGVKELALCEDIARATGVVILSDAARQALYHTHRAMNAASDPVTFIAALPPPLSVIMRRLWRMHETLKARRESSG
jgi:hypothetical protein